MSPSMPERRTVGSFSKRVSHMPVIQDRVAVAPECPDRKIIVVRQLRRRFSAAQSPKHAGPCLVGDYFAGEGRQAAAREAWLIALPALAFWLPIWPRIADAAVRLSRPRSWRNRYRTV